MNLPKALGEGLRIVDHECETLQSHSGAAAGQVVRSWPSFLWTVAGRKTLVEGREVEVTGLVTSKVGAREKSRADDGAAKRE